ncbi:MAG: hypothetical protein KAG61_12615 [Bacteriovoracaceae bacterium]|nr:hypothetical protein [Bacteriovoracaceae bacterium]
MKNLILFTLLLTLSSCGKVNQIAPYEYEEEISNYSSVHKNVRNLPQHLTFNALNNPSDENVEDLVEGLTEDISGTEDKVKAIHDWIAINIFYDLDRYEPAGDLYRPYFYLEVLRSRLTMCGGYTDLFFVMAKMAGIRVSSVTGAAANAHIWNAVWDGAEWKHVDATWDAGSYDNGKAKYSYSSTYFFKTAAFMNTVTAHADGGGYTYDETQSPYSEY